MNDNFFKWILPLLILICFLLAISSIIDSKLELKDLVKCEGIVTNYEYYNTKSKGTTYKNMRLILTNGLNLKVTNEWERKYLVIENALNESKLIEYYHRKPSQAKWTPGSKNTIYQLKIGNQMIFDIKERHDNSLGGALLSGIICIIGIIVLIVRKFYNK